MKIKKTRCAEQTAATDDLFTRATHRIILGLSCGICVTVGLGAVASAQQQPPPREVIEPRVPATPLPSAVEPSSPDVAPDSGLPEGTGIVFQLRGVQIDGATIYGQEDFAEAVQPLIGTEIKLDDLKKITDGIEAVYKRDGYLAVRAVVPPQTVRDGSIRINVVEGYVANIVLRGDLNKSEARVKALLAPLINAKPLKWAAAEEALLTARDTPGVRLLAALRRDPSGTPGAMVLVVDVTQKPYDGFVSVSNHAPKSTGRFVTTAGVGLNSLLLPGDRAQVIGLFTLDIKEQLVGQLKYQAPINEKLTVKASLSRGLSDPGDTLSPFLIDYRTATGTLEAEYTLLRSRARSAWIYGGFDFTHQRSKNNGTVSIDENLRVAFLGARVLTRELFSGVLDADFQARFGLDLLGANEKGDLRVSPAGSDPQFALAKMNVRYSRAFTDRYQVRLNALAQISSENLPSLEKFSLGSYTIGRGFDPGSLRGDHGLALSAEAGYRPEMSFGPYISDVEVFGFLEGGWVWNGSSQDALMSAGVGARVELQDRLSIETMLALPLKAPSAPADGVHLMVRLTGLF